MIRLVRSLVCVLLTATAVQAGITTSNVNVLVTGKRCGDLKEVYLVINGEDLEDHWFKLEPAGTCRWKADLGDGSISTSIASFSLRGDFARSDCQRAAANEADLSANLEFACCPSGPLKNMSVKIQPPMPASYVRDVRPYPGERIPGIKCTEKATFSEGQGSISHVQTSGESLSLHFGPTDKKHPTPGLLLDDIDRTMVLTRNDVVYRLMVQRAKGKEKSAPTLSSDAISLDIKKLGELKLERAEIGVMK